MRGDGGGSLFMEQAPRCARRARALILARTCFVQDSMCVQSMERELLQAEVFGPLWPKQAKHGRIHVSHALCKQLIDDSFRRTLCSLDLAEGRWYKIPAYIDDHDAAAPLAPLVHTIPRHLAVNDGLVCEFCKLDDDKKKRGEHQVILLDPIAKSRWELPALPFFHGRTNFFLPSWSSSCSSHGCWHCQQ